jgi:hypothetical protein
MSAEPEREWPDAERLALVEDVSGALGEVWSGASTLDAEEVLHHLEMRGRTVQ